MSVCIFQEGRNGTGPETPDLTDDRKNGGSLEMGRQTGWKDALVHLFSVCMCKCMYMCVSMCVSCTRKVEDTQVHTHTDKQVRQTLNKFVKPT